MKKMLINATDELRVAITYDGVLADLDVEKPGIEQKKSNIYKGKITSIEPSLAAVFVNYGSERHGFLPLKEISPEYFSDFNPNSDEPIDIKKVLRIGQPVVIQVEKEERGSKGAALTTFLSLAGSYLVLMPNNPRAGGISRRIEGEERDQLRDSLSKLTMPEGMGVIIRTAGVSKSAEELQWDLDVLLRYFEALKQAASMNKAAPYLIHQESDVVIRTLRDYLRQDINEVVFDDNDAYQRAREYIKQVRPDFVERIKLYEDETPLFSRYQIEQQIETSYQRELRLPSGGSIVIDQTEALVSIDINSSRATKGKSIEETALNTNVEAAQEIARQLRLRDIGGLIVIDFIDMTQSRNQRQVENTLREALHIDRARIQISRISRFGLLEMSRQRLRSGINKSSRVTCPRCSGTGGIRSVESLGLSIIHLIQEQAVKTDKHIFQVQVPVDVATFLINEQRDKLATVEKATGVKLIIIPNQHLLTPNYNIRHLKSSTGERGGAAVPSYKLLRSTKPEAPTTHKTTAKKSSEEPVINQFLSTETPSKKTLSKSKSTDMGVIRRVLNKMFGTSAEPEKEVAEKPARRTSGNRSNNSNRHRSNNGDRRPRGNSNNPNSTRRNTSSNRNTHKANTSDARGTRDTKDTRDRNDTRAPNAETAEKTDAAHDKDTQQQRTRRGTRGGQQRSNSRKTNENSRTNAPKKPQERANEKSPATENNTGPKKMDHGVDSIKAQKPKSEEIAALASENQVKRKPAAKPSVAQSNVEQRPMTAGKRISPVTKKTEGTTSTSAPAKPAKPAYQPGRKIAAAGEKAPDTK
jgi:ribonuclease E